MKELEMHNGDPVDARREECPYCGDRILDALLEKHKEAVHPEEVDS